MTAATPRQHHRRTGLTEQRLILALLVVGFSSVFWSVDPSAAAAAEDPCLAGLPVPTPRPPAIRVVQLVNCSDQTLLGAANAAHAADQPATPVFPREGTWVMGPASSSTQNVLTIDIPPAWADTSPEGSIGPNIWVRTGCRYDIAANIAQCEVGGAGGNGHPGGRRRCFRPWCPSEHILANPARRFPSELAYVGLWRRLEADPENRTSG
jgi:hypothetical protein